jgi:hypothetical protein
MSSCASVTSTRLGYQHIRFKAHYDDQHKICVSIVKKYHSLRKYSKICYIYIGVHSSNKLYQMLLYDILVGKKILRTNNS